MGKNSRVQITTYVSPEVAERLEVLAVEQDRSLASLLRLALQEILERDENAKTAA